MGINLKILKAGNGDSIILRFLGDDQKFKNILIDGGNKKEEYNSFLKSEILNIQNSKENIDLIIITHTDQDHVKGIQYLLNDKDIDKKIIKEIWFNSFENSQHHDTNDISYIESCKIQSLITKFNIPRSNDIITGTDEVIFFGAKISLLSPTKDDINNLVIKNSDDISGCKDDYEYSLKELIHKNSKIFNEEIEDLDLSIENRASIAFLFEVNYKSILFLGDANPDVVESSLKEIIKKQGTKKIKVNAVKLSHHASQRSLSLSLVDLIDSTRYIISTNGKKSCLPNKLTFAKILNRQCKQAQNVDFIFNYDDVIEKLNFSDDDKKQYNFSCHFPNHPNGYILNL